MQQELRLNLTVSDGCILSHTGEYTLAYEVTKPEIFTLSASDYEVLQQAWVKALRVLPPSSVVHAQDWYIETAYSAARDISAASFLGAASERYFNGRPYLNHRAFLFLTRLSGKKRPASPLLSTLSSRTLIPEDILQPEAVQEFTDLAGQFERILTDSGLIRLRRVQDEELTSDRERTGLIEQYCQLVDGNLRSPEIRDIDLSEGVRIGDCQALLYTLADLDHLPSTCSSGRPYLPYSTEQTMFPVGFTATLGPLLPHNHIYNQFIRIENPTPTIQQLELKQRRMQSLANQSRANGQGKDAIHAFLNEMHNGQKQLVKVHFNLISWSDEPAGIKELKRQIPSALAHLGITPHLETVSAPQIWWAGIPGNAANLPRNEYFDTFSEQAACFLSMESPYRSDEGSNTVLFGDRITGKPVAVDLFHSPAINNRGMFVCGSSGGGKSTWCNHVFRTLHDQGGHVVIADTGNSYKGLCELVGGYYFTYTEEAPIRFNPFYLGKGMSLDTEKKESLKALLVTLWKQENDEFNRSEYVALTNALQGYYIYLEAHPEVFPCFDTFYEYLQKEFVSVLQKDQVKEKDFDVSNFLYVLRPFYRDGEFDYLLNARENLDLLTERFVVFELDNIKDHVILLPVVSLIIMEMVISKMRKIPGVLKAFAIEEAWKAMAQRGMAQFMKYAYKTFRKLHGIPIIVTQEVDDVISSPIIKDAIIGNSDIKVLMDMRKFVGKFDALQATLGMSEKGKTILFSVNRANEPGRQYREFYLELGGQVQKVFRYEPSPEEYYAYTTNQSEKVKVQEYAARHGSLQEGITRLVADMKRLVLPLLVMAGFAILPLQRASAQIELIEEVVKQAIMAIDLNVQRLQTQTLFLQDAQKQLENVMQQTHLNDITEWVQRQKDLYSEYYQELWQVKDVLGTYSTVKDMISKQARLVVGYKQAYSSLQLDSHFTPAEIEHIQKVLNGILNQSVETVNQLGMLIRSFSSQMSDGDRLQLINEMGDRIDRNYNDLEAFTQENILLSLQRTRDERDLAMVRALYGLP